ncbi:MAG: acetylglutamate kinase [Clostridiales bacterium]|nr:acetylglutamate kinase [Clostridiales bacterium]
MQKYINKANILIEALPYIQKLSGKTVVIKYGGNAMISESLREKVMEDITLLKYVGVNPIVVHGGGPDITEALGVYNVKSEFVNGLRVTDSRTMSVAQMVLEGKTNKAIVSSLNVKGGNAIGLCGIDGRLIQCEKYMPRVDGKPADIGFVGKITGINAHALQMLANDQYIPVVAPIGIGADGESYNINADTVAGAIAAALKAEKLMLLTDVEGVKRNGDSKDIIYEISQKEIFKMIDNGEINGGMIPKTLSCIEAIDAGVKRVHIIDGRIPHCLLLEIFTDTGIGTMITA